MKCHPEVSAQLLQTIAELDKELAAVQFVSKAWITMPRSAEKRVTRNGNDRDDFGGPSDRRERLSFYVRPQRCGPRGGGVGLGVGVGVGVGVGRGRGLGGGFGDPLVGTVYSSI